MSLLIIAPPRGQSSPNSLSVTMRRSWVYSSSLVMICQRAAETSVYFLFGGKIIIETVRKQQVVCLWDRRTDRRIVRQIYTTHRQTNRKAGSETGGQMYRQIYQTYRQTHRPTERCTDRQTARQTDGQRDRGTDKKTGRQSFNRR